MRFYSLQILWLLAPWVFMPALWFYLEGRAEKKFSKFASPVMRNKLVRGITPGRKRLKFILVWLALGFAIVAWARPQIGTSEENLKSQGLDLVFLLDISYSMATEDVVPSRLKKSKHIIRSFLDRLSGDRVGVVAFAGSSFPVAPLTTDYDYLRQVLETLDEHSVTNQGTDVGSGLETSLELIERGGLEDGDDNRESTSASKVVVILSDGEDLVGEESKALPQIKQKGIRIYAIGVGSLKGAPIPMRDENGVLQGYKKDKSGTTVVSKLVAATLEKIATKTTGKYFTSTVNENEVDDIIAELSQLNRAEGGSRKVVVYGEFFQIPLLLALFLLMLNLWLFDRGKSIKVATLMLVLFGVGAIVGGPYAAAAQGIQDYRENRKGIEAFESGDFANSVNHFGNAQAEDPDTKVNNFNLGTALLKTDTPERAIPELLEGTKAEDPLISAKSSYNLGQAFEKQEDHEKALRAYQKGLDVLRDLKKQNQESAEITKRIKESLESAQAKQQEKQQQQKDDKDQKKDGKQGNQQDPKQGDNKDKGKDEKKDDKDKAKNEEKKFKIPQEKQKFKSEQLTPQDAKRLMQQLKEQDNKTQQRFRRSKNAPKTEQRRDENNGKDW